jgi:hypothetical protein
MANLLGRTAIGPADVMHAAYDLVKVTSRTAVIGLIGAGRTGGTLAGLPVGAGYHVVLSNERGPLPSATWPVGSAHGPAPARRPKRPEPETSSSWLFHSRRIARFRPSSSLARSSSTPPTTCPTATATSRRSTTRAPHHHSCYRPTWPGRTWSRPSTPYFWSTSRPWPGRGAPQTAAALPSPAMTSWQGTPRAPLSMPSDTTPTTLSVVSDTSADHGSMLSRVRYTEDALFEYLEIFHNRRRRHSSLGMLTDRIRTPPQRRPTRSMTTLQHPGSGKPRAHQSLRKPQGGSSCRLVTTRSA